MSTDDLATTADSLYREVGRAEWARLAPGIPNPLNETEVVQMRGIGDRLDLTEVREVYLPLSRLLSTYAENTKRLGAETAAFLGEDDSTTPFVVGVAGVGRRRQVDDRPPAARADEPLAGNAPRRARDD